MAIFKYCLVFLGLVSISTTASAETWHRADTDNFIVYSTGNKADLGKRALKLERFDSLMRLRYRVPPVPSPNRPTVYLFDSERDVMETRACQKNGTVVGFYTGRIDGSYFVSHRRQQSGRDALQPQEVLFHEYGHHFMFRYFPFAYPGWYREGFAEYYATTEIDDDGNWNYGKPPKYRGATLIGGRQIPVDRMLTKPQSELSPEESYQVYTRGWLLTHMLHSDPDRNKQLNAYLTAIARGTDRGTAARDAFGDLDQLERDLRAYMGKSPTYIRGRKPINYDGKMEVTTLSDTDSRFAALKLANTRYCDRKKTAEALEKLTEEAPNRADIWAELADAYHMLAHADAREAEERANKDLPDDAEKVEVAPQMAKALATIDKALALDPDNARAQALKAEFLMDVAQHSEEAGYWQLARKHAIASNRLDPDSPFALQMFYNSYAQAKGPISDSARAALARAFELAPEVNGLRIQYALDLASQGRFNEAIDTVEFLIGSPHGARAGKLALLKIEAMRDGASLAAASEIELDDEEEDNILH